MSEEWIEVGVVVARRTLDNPWASHSWHVHGVLAAPPDMTPWTSLRRDAAEELIYAGKAAFPLHAGATAHYRDNLQSAERRLWVLLREVATAAGGEQVEVVAVTADPYEGEAMADGGDMLEATRMPEEIVARLEAFFAANHVERPFFKRQRDRADPQALARRGKPLSD